MLLLCVLTLTRVMFLGRLDKVPMLLCPSKGDSALVGFSAIVGCPWASVSLSSSSSMVPGRRKSFCGSSIPPLLHSKAGSSPIEYPPLLDSAILTLSLSDPLESSREDLYIVARTDLSRIREGILEGARLSLVDDGRSSKLPGENDAL
ncbi:hypothetical protein KM043_011977 [Ampulex compressa]|nr:hypothetical protein KM043_011977 [Ampulex compressa]